MINRVKVLLITSLLCNLLFISAGVTMFNHRGGNKALLNSVSFIANPSASSANDSPYYLNRVSLFRLLPASQNDIIFLGDSITDSCEWAELFQNGRIKNRGISEDTTAGVLKRLPQIAESRPAKIFIMIGINDLASNKGISFIHSQYQQMISTIQQTSPRTEIFIQSILPVNNRLYGNRIHNQNVVTLNKKLSSLTNQSNVHYIDLYSRFAKDDQLDAKYSPDGLHLNGTGYVVWKNTIEKYIG